MTVTMSDVTLCDPSMTDGAIKLRIIKSLLRKFRGKVFAKCCRYGETYAHTPLLSQS